MRRGRRSRPRNAPGENCTFHGPDTGLFGVEAEARTTVGGVELGVREVAVAAYEPKMNVTPNAVAVKE